LKISVFGLGYVGAVSCGCLADLGHTIIGVDVSKAKVDLINNGESPIMEEGLLELLRKARSAGRLSATTSAEHAVKASELALVCVGTPSTPSGGVNSTYLERVCAEIGAAINQHNPPFFTVLNRSTSLPAIHRKLQRILEQTSNRRIGDGLGYVCHPEFLREGAAVADFYGPPKIVFGAADRQSEELCRKLYPSIDAETFFVTPEVASMIKYADNCFHAVKVTFGNEIGMICKELGVNAHAVMDVFCKDRKLNISPRYLKPGFAFGGSCLPKDLRGIMDAARETATPLPMLSGALESNRIQIERLLRRIGGLERPPIGIVGLAFKEGTDDIRESPMVAVVEYLTGKGHPIRIYDEHLSVQNMVGANLSFALQSIPHLAELLTHDLQAVVNSSRILVVSHRLSPQRWSEIKWKPDLRVIDLANVESLRNAPQYEGLYW
jgi:GDP-mannose 6-dehydrogenase